MLRSPPSPKFNVAYFKNKMQETPLGLRKGGRGMGKWETVPTHLSEVVAV